jgi:hypothetical protein
VVVREQLPDGSEVEVIWSWMSESKRAQLVTVYFQAFGFRRRAWKSGWRPGRMDWGGTTKRHGKEERGNDATSGRHDKMVVKSGVFCGNASWRPTGVSRSFWYAKCIYGPADETRPKSTKFATVKTFRVSPC